MRLKTLLLSILCFPFLVNAQTFSGSGGLIPDDGSTAIDFTINVSGLVPAALNSTHGLVSACININHTWDADLQISLIAPDGTQVNLATGVGSDQDNFTNTCFSQSSSTPIGSGTAPFTGTWKPMGNMGYLNNGQNGNGAWKLHILDGYTQDQGTLLNWTITFGNNAPIVAPFTSSNLPIVIINTANQNIPDEPKLMANMGIVYNGAGVLNHTTDPYNNYNGKIGIELRGSSSQMFPKKTYGFETWTNAGADTGVSLITMPKESDWVLSASYSDKSLMNNVLAYKLFNDFGNYAPRTRFVELVLNNQYMGVYILMEKIKRDTNRVNVHKLSATDTSGSALTGGYILKIDKMTGSGGSGFTSAYAPSVNGNGQTIFFQYDYPSELNIKPKQQDYIKRFVDSFETALHQLPLYDTNTGWRRYADENSFIRYLILNEVSKNVDGYRLSTYLYKAKDTKGNRLYVGPPWDYDIAFGNADYCGGNTDTGWAFQFGSECDGDYWQVPFWWQRLMQDTSFRNRLKCAYSGLRATVLDTTHLFHWIDSTAQALHDPKDRNFDTWPILGTYVWPNPSPIPADYAGEIWELKSWLRKRIAWLDTHIPGTCYPPVLDVPTIDKPLCSVFPNPFSNELKLLINTAGHYSILLSGIDGKLIQADGFNAAAGTVKDIFPSGDRIQAGVYILQVRTGKGISSFKLIKE